MSLIIFSQQPISFHFRFSLHLQHISELQLKSPKVLECIMGGLTAVDLVRLSVTLHPGGCIDGVTKEAVSGHLDPHNPSTAGT